MALNTTFIVPLYSVLATRGGSPVVFIQCIDLYTRHIRTNMMAERYTKIKQNIPLLITKPIVTAYDAEQDEVLIVGEGEQLKIVKKSTFYNMIKETEFEWREPQSKSVPTVKIAGHRIIKYSQIPQEMIVDLLETLEIVMQRSIALGVPNYDVLAASFNKACISVLKDCQKVLQQYDCTRLWKALAGFLIKHSLRNNLMIYKDLTFSNLITIRKPDDDAPDGAGEVAVGVRPPFHYTISEYSFMEVQSNKGMAHIGLLNEAISSRRVYLGYDWSDKSKVYPLVELLVSGAFEDIAFGQIPVMDVVHITGCLCEFLSFEQLVVRETLEICIENAVYLKRIIVPKMEKLIIKFSNCNTAVQVLTTDGKKYQPRWSPEGVGALTITQ